MINRRFLDLVLVQHIKQLWRNNDEKIYIMGFIRKIYS